MLHFVFIRFWAAASSSFNLLKLKRHGTFQNWIEREMWNCRRRSDNTSYIPWCIKKYRNLKPKSSKGGLSILCFLLVGHFFVVWTIEFCIVSRYNAHAFFAYNETGTLACYIWTHVPFIHFIFFIWLQNDHRTVNMSQSKWCKMTSCQNNLFFR